MKKNLILVGLISAFIFSGCSNSSNAKSGEEIQKLIDKTGWTIERPKGGRLIESVDLIIDEQKEFSISHDLSNDTISSIYFKETDKEYYAVINENDVNKGDHMEDIEDGKSDCFLYDLDKNKEADKSEATSYLDIKCSVENLEKLQELKKLRDKYLNDAGITMDELYSWGKWYFNNNK